MHILFFSSVKVPSDGGGGWINSLIRELIKKEDIKVSVIFKSNTNEIKKINIKNSLTIYELPMGNQKLYHRIVNNYVGNRERIDQKDVNIYVNLINHIKPDIIQVFGSEQNWGLFQKHITIPTVIHIQSVYHPYHHKALSGFTLIDIKKHSTLKARLLNETYFQGYKKGKKIVKREQEILSNSKYLLGRTDWDRRCLKILAPNAVYYHIDEIIRDEFYNKIWNKIEFSETLQLTTTIGGALYKGFETIVDTLEILNEYQFGTKIQWHIAGLTIDSEVVKLMKKKKKGNLPTNLVFKGLLDSKELSDLLLSSDIYIHPSHIENSPNSVAEAMLTGIPIISTYVGGLSSILQNNVNALLIQDGDPYSLAGTITELSENFSFAIKIGQNARKTALERHDKDKIVNSLLEVYKKIIWFE